MEAKHEVVDGTIPVIISVGAKDDILNAIAWTKKHSKARLIGWRSG